MQTLINDLLAYLAGRHARRERWSPVDLRGAFCDARSATCTSAIDESGAELSRTSRCRRYAADRIAARRSSSRTWSATRSSFAARQPPQVHVAAERDDGAWRFAVRDNGIGIDAAVRRPHLPHLPAPARAGPSIRAPASAWRSARRSSSATAAGSGSSPLARVVVRPFSSHCPTSTKAASPASAPSGDCRILRPSAEVVAGSSGGKVALTVFCAAAVSACCLAARGVEPA